MLNAKSVHLFAWPFELCHGQTLDGVRASITARGWKKKERNFLHPDDFMLLKYLSSSARSIFCEDKDICEIYTLPVSEHAVYVVDDFELPIFSLELHLYHFGIGILFIHIKNDRYDEVNVIRKINDCGRRISLPFLPDSPEGFLLCADRLGIRTETEEFITDFRRAVRLWCDRKDSVEQDVIDCLLQPADFLFRLVGCSREQIETTSDDRMFTFCLLRDDRLSSEIAQHDLEESDDLTEEQGTDRFDERTPHASEKPDDLTEEQGTNRFDERTPHDSDKPNDLTERLYQIIFVDPTDATCQNRKMRKRLLQNAIYERWSDCGTLYGVTNFSMICITAESPSINAAVVKPFLTEYKYLVSLVLAQKIGISMFSELAGNIVKGVDDSKLINKRQVKNLINLQEQYITFKNQLLILEASAQEQGIDLYQLLRQQMQISDEQAILDEQLESLYEVTNVSNGNRLEGVGIKLAVLAIGVDIILNIVLAILG